MYLCAHHNISHKDGQERVQNGYDGRKPRTLSSKVLGFLNPNVPLWMQGVRLVLLRNPHAAGWLVEVPGEGREAVGVQDDHGDHQAQYRADNRLPGVMPLGHHPRPGDQRQQGNQW